LTSWFIDTVAQDVKMTFNNKLKRVQRIIENDGYDDIGSNFTVVTTLIPDGDFLKDGVLHATVTIKPYKPRLFWFKQYTKPYYFIITQYKDHVSVTSYTSNDAEKVTSKAAKLTNVDTIIFKMIGLINLTQNKVIK
jgi:hypothetical protein